MSYDITSQNNKNKKEVNKNEYIRDGYCASVSIRCDSWNWMAPWKRIAFALYGVWAECWRYFHQQAFEEEEKMTSSNGLKSVVSKCEKKGYGISFHTHAFIIPQPRWVRGYHLTEESLGTIESVWNHIHNITMEKAIPPSNKLLGILANEL